MQIIIEIKNKTDKVKHFFLFKLKLEGCRYHDLNDFDFDFKVVANPEEDKEIEKLTYDQVHSSIKHVPFAADFCFKNLKKTKSVEIICDRYHLLYLDRSNRFQMKVKKRGLIYFSHLTWLQLITAPKSITQIILEVKPEVKFDFLSIKK